MLRSFACGAFGFFALSSLLHAQSAAPAPAAAPFAAIPPSTVATLPAKASTPDGQDIIQQATADLTRPPGALAKLHTEGTLPHQGIRDQSAAAEKDFPVLLDLALAYRLTGDARFLKQTDAYFSAWFPLYHASLNPIDETNFDHFIFAYDLTRSALPAATQTAVNGFLTELAQGYLKFLQNPKRYGDNWESHRVKLATLAAYALGDAGMIAQARQDFSTQIAHNIRPDGSVLDFEKRDALHYVVYDLEPLSVACLAAKAHGQDWFHEVPPGGASVAQGVDWFLPYARGEKTHQEFVHSVVKFDAQRAQAGVPGFTGRWDRKGALGLLAFAAALDPARQAELDQFTASTGQRVPAWIVLVFPSR